MLSEVALNRAKVKVRFFSEAKAKAPCVLSEGSKIVSNSYEANALYAFDEAKAFGS